MLIQNPELDHIMSRDAKQLRDSVLDICLKYGTASKGTKFVREFIDQIIEQYNPLNWESAVLYGYWKQILESVSRLTSKRYKDQKSDKNTPKDTEVWRLGSVDGPRNKEIDWLSVAKFEHCWWYGTTQWPRDSRIMPSAFNTNRDAFGKVYKLFINWMLIDFSYKNLYVIWDLSTKYSSSEIKRCMNLVVDKSKRSVEYLVPIIEKEQAILRAELLEREDLNDHSKSIISAMLDIVGSKEPVDWEKLEKEMTTDSNNQEIFNEVKLS